MLFRVTVIRKGYRRGGKDGVRTGYRKATIEVDADTVAHAKAIVNGRELSQLDYGPEYNFDVDGEPAEEYGSEHDVDHEVEDIEFVPATPGEGENWQALYQQALIQLNILQLRNEGMAKGIQDKDKANKRLSKELEAARSAKNKAVEDLSNLQQQDRYNAAEIAKFGDLLENVVEFLVDKTSLGQKLETIVGRVVERKLEERRRR